ncbi:MAG: hypothetical protein H6672_00310 [Anaerolineaceae bacterium]|nr:hypothetical protein [Anaerolineaceae bacterium]
MKRHLLVLMVIMVIAAFPASFVLADGSRDLFPAGAPADASRGNLQFSTNSYGPAQLIRWRTILYAYMNGGESLLMGSSAVGVNNGNIFVYAPGAITGPTGNETIGAPIYDCQTQRATAGLPNAIGQITTRAEELAGPDTVPAGGNPGGYVPCTFTAPADGIYPVIFYGPAGLGAANGTPTGDINLAAGTNFDATQGSTVAAWDVTVRAALNNPADITGRVYTNYLGMSTGGNGRRVYPTLYTTTTDGYIYQTELNGLDPFGFVIYGSQKGFLDTDGATTLYHDVLSNTANLSALDGGVGMDRPAYPMFFDQPQNVTLNALGIPINPVPPVVTAFSFIGSISGNMSLVGAGGTFQFTSNVDGLYQLTISRNGVDFDPSTLTNRVLRGDTVTGVNTIVWDGLDNEGTAFPVGTYQVRMNIRAGEYHFPMIDAENSINGGPTYTLTNPPGACPPFTGGCSGAFYDDRSYRTLAGTVVGGAVPNTLLCGLTPPTTANSNLLTGFNSTTNQRAFGAAAGGNTNTACTGAFGDVKGLDLWTFFPSGTAATPLRIVATVPPPPPAAPPATAVPAVEVLPTFPPSVTSLPSTGVSPWSAARPLALTLMGLGVIGVAALLLRRK